MRLRQLLLASFVVLGLAPQAASGEVYRWTDAEGKVHFTSDLSQVPARQRDAAEAGARAGKRGSVQRFESSTPAAAAAPAAPAGAVPAATPAAQEERYGGRNEAEWRALAKKYRDAIERLEPRAEACEGDEFRWKPGAGRRAYREEVAEADACSRMKSELDMNRTWLRNLEESAHRAGAPPGWMRE
jgi:Domain of unknown function (DUF4124)